MLNFIISNSPKIWRNNSKSLFIADPYVFHVLQMNNELSRFDSIKVSEYLRNTKEDLINDSNFVDEKYEKYIGIIANRLNEIHNKDYDSDFWQKSLSMAFIRYLTTFYNTFKICETYFNPKLHYCNVLSLKSYFTPNDFEDHRACFQNSDFGQEQIFSIYINLLYPDKFSQVDLDCVGKHNKHATLNQKIRSSKFFYKSKSLYYKLKYGISKGKIRIGVIGSYY